MQLLLEGKSSVEMGALLSLSSHTVDSYRSRMMRKLELRDVLSLVKFAIRQGLISLE